MLMQLSRSDGTRRLALGRLGVVACGGAVALMLTFSAMAQEPTPADAAQPPTAPAPSPAAETLQPPPAPVVPAAPAATPAVTPAATQTPPAATTQSGAFTEEQLKQLLVGKALYLRGGYLDNALNFDARGRLTSHSAQGSYTLSAIQIDKVRLTKRKVELDGARYGLHFLGQLAFEDPSSAIDRVRITPKKRMVKITIDRELVVVPKKKKEPKASKEKKGKIAAPETPPAAPEAVVAPAAADFSKVTTTVSPVHAAKVLKDALDQIFAQGLDERMMAAMPDFWKLYYQAVAAKADYRPKDPAIFRQSAVDRKAVLLTRFVPDSNEFAQASGVAGMAQYHVVIGPDGKPGEIAVGRPIGFGLDENAVAAIRKANFQPAIKDGKPVSVLLDLDVPFRIFSKRTAVTSQPEPTGKPAEPVLPGPYSVPRP